MDKTVEEIRHLILLRLYFERHSSRFEKVFLRAKVSFIMNQILRENDIKDVYSSVRGEKVFIFHKPTARIVCEIKIEGEEDEKYIQNPSIHLSNLRGVIDDKTPLSKLISDVQKLGERKKWKQR